MAVFKQMQQKALNTVMYFLVCAPQAHFVHLGIPECLSIAAAA